MKILFVTYCRAMLGANRSLVQLMSDLRERYDVEPYVLMPSVEDGSLHKELERLDIPYFIRPIKAWVVAEDAKFRRLRGIKACIENRRYIKDLIDKITDKNFDMIYSNNSTIQVGADLANKMKLPHIWHIREYGRTDYHIVFSYSSKAVKAKFDDADAIIAVSKSLENYIKENISSTANTFCIYNGIYNQKSLRSCWNEDLKLNFCCVGALQDGKNQLELLKASYILIKKGIDDFHITLIGEGNEYEDVLREYCRINNLSDFVTFRGYCDNVTEILDSMDVGIICSKNEAFGRVTVEYMFSSMPVIGAKGSGTSELILHGENGFLYAGGYEEQLAENMHSFICDRSLMKKMGKAAFEHADKNFTSERNTDQIYQIIKKVI